jgi:hypothetical protein
VPPCVADGFRACRVQGLPACTHGVPTSPDSATTPLPDAPRRVVIFGTSANPPTGHSGHTGIVQHLVSLYDEVRLLMVVGVWEASGAWIAPPRKQTQGVEQDWILKGLQGGRVYLLAACWGGEALLLSPGAAGNAKPTHWPGNTATMASANSAATCERSDARVLSGVLPYSLLFSHTAVNTLRIVTLRVWRGATENGP